MGVTLKLATSMDGRIATAAGDSRWITGPEARAEVHRLRAQSDAVLVGLGTALADDPELTVRLDGFAGPQPARVVLDSRLRTPLTAKLVQTARAVPTYIVSVAGSPAALAEAGVKVLTVKAGADGRPDLVDAVSALRARGLGALLVEGGGQTAAAFLRAGLVDRIEWFRASILLGEEGRPGIGALGVGALAAAPKFRRSSVHAVGDDLWERYERL
jgi:diaminohydroxyphosphoribosylaminopyrimidine deaminase/5-amino-6-(5-phosphoribosylamino)uracil reductase